MADPGKAYHLEFVSGSQAAAGEIHQLLCGFSLNAGTMPRREGYISYIKGIDDIITLLTHLGAHAAVLELENIRILKEMRGNVNRQVNCETANINKTVSAAVKQTEDIEYIRDTIGLEALPDNLQEIARVRLMRPDATLKELGEALNPAVGKSGVNHRLRKLGAVAEELRQQAARDS